MNSEKILSIFKEITLIPRESGHEELIVGYLVRFAETHGLECRTDAAGNVVITREASPGFESRPTIVLQGHTDMVCEKNAGVDHDFTKDPINYVIENGWMVAKDTTLGADCGIGIAAELAALTDPAPCGRLECLFTASEETGMDGAFALESGFITGKTLINLDSEDEGELFVGCAGGIDTTAVFSYIPEPQPSGSRLFRIRVFNGIGGHSGDDINKGRANAVQLLARFLCKALSDGHGKVNGNVLRSIDGGNKRNAIAREAEAVIAVRGDVVEFEKAWKDFAGDVKSEYAVTEPELSFAVNPVACIDDDHAGENFGEENLCMSAADSLRLAEALFAAPHGVIEMSADIPGLVETSTNLASVKMLDKNRIRIGTSQRSSVTSARRAAAAKVEAHFHLAGAEVTHGSEYPGWKPNLDSDILRCCVESYRRLFGTEPAVKAIHAGLECGLFLEKYPDLDMISFGPTLRGVHAPGERLDLASLDKFTLLLDDVIHGYDGRQD